MIKPGLERISRLVTNIPWNAIHVAGTNGKGSICAYSSAMIHAAGLRCGRFTSPHLLDRWDCITIDEKPVKESLFRDVWRKVQSINKTENIAASEFELLTATAFELFSQESVPLAVIEVGMGGRLDATNIIESPLVSVIAKIALDHQDFLGHSLEEIAREKAGIIKTGSPCVIDATNDDSVIAVLQAHAKDVKAGSVVQAPGPDTQALLEAILVKTGPGGTTAPHQRVNLSCAVAAVQIVLAKLGLPFEPQKLLTAALSLTWPGRLQSVSIESLTGRKTKVLLDGAHNPSSTTALASFVDRNLRRTSQVVTWVIAASQGKNVKQMFPSMFRRGDNIITVEFGPVVGMPWVHAMDSTDLLAQIRNGEETPSDVVTVACSDILRGLKLATDMAGPTEGLMVICGSLYLVSDVLRMLRDASSSGGTEPVDE